MVWKKLGHMLSRPPLLIIILYCGIGLMGGAIFHYLFPGEYAGYFPVIGGFFLVVGLVLNYLLSQISKKHAQNPKRLLNVYMLARAAKFLVTLVFFAICLVFYADHKVAFTVTLLIYYFIYMVLELYMYYYYEKQRKINAVK